MVSTSVMMARSSPALSGTALPRMKNQALVVLVSRMTPTERGAPTPPVERPMRWVSETKSSLAVPVWNRAREKMVR